MNPVNNFVMLYRHNSYVPNTREMYFQDINALQIAFNKLNGAGYMLICLGLNEVACKELEELKIK